MIRAWTATEARRALLMRQEIAMIDLRSEAEFATGHPLFAAVFSPADIEAEAAKRVPRRTVPILLYGLPEADCVAIARRLRQAGYTQAGTLAGGVAAWRDAGYELFIDVNSPSKAFGELVEARRHTPYVTAAELDELVRKKADIAVLDARRPDEFYTMSIPTGRSLPGAELVLRARAVAPNPETMLVVNCAGRTRSIIGAQSLLNAGIPNPVRALRNGTIGWVLDGLPLAEGVTAALPQVTSAERERAAAQAAEVAYRAGVRQIDHAALMLLAADTARTLYCFDVRTPAEHMASHPLGFIGVPGGQLVQETDHYAPVRGARIAVFDDLGARGSMTASWLAQMGWEVFTIGTVPASLLMEGNELPYKRPAQGRYRRPYEGTDNAAAAMQAYLDWEYGLVAQLERDATHGFFVI